MAVDTHSHLFDEAFDDDRAEVIKRIQENNINKVVVVGISHETNELAYNLAKDFDFMYPTAGLHPDQVTISTQEDIDKLEKFIQTHKVYAIGECGLDYHWEPETKEKQKWLFDEQIKLAIKYDLPLVIHSRDAILDTFNALEKYQGKVRFVMHCYSSSWEMAKRFLKLGGYISLGGPVTFKNAREPKEVAINIPIDRLLIETDCPYLAPTPMRGKRNESSYVRYVLEEIAKLRDVDFIELEKQLDENSNRLFRF